MKPFKINNVRNSVLLIVPLLIGSCKKAVSMKDKRDDSIIVSEQSANTLTSDSQELKINKDTVEMIQNNGSEVNEVKNGQIIKVVDGEKLPLLIDEKFTDKNQKLILKIRNYEKTSLKASILPQNNNMNIRFNQIRTPDGKFDGPFSRDISYEIPKSGEVWLIIGKNLMAEEEIAGDFSVRVE